MPPDRDMVFNYPTMAECCKVAALDGLNKLSLWADVEESADDFVPAIRIDSITEVEALLART